MTRLGSFYIYFPDVKIRLQYTHFKLSTIKQKLGAKLLYELVKMHTFLYRQSMPFFKNIISVLKSACNMFLTELRRNFVLNFTKISNKVVFTPHFGLPLLICQYINFEKISI